ncbi:MAG: hypothetical protein Q7U04_11185 [Bacteriovorax sp.]|nr:hypothetical protein [Bacteriovorax sp.]
MKRNLALTSLILFLSLDAFAGAFQYYSWPSRKKKSSSSTSKKVSVQNTTPKDGEVTPPIAPIAPLSATDVVATNAKNTAVDYSQTDALLKMFYALESQLADIRNKARDIRLAISSSPAFISDVDCSSSNLNSNFKTNCEQLLKLNAAHAEVNKRVDQLNTSVAEFHRGDFSGVRSKDDALALMSTAIVSKAKAKENLRKECAGIGVSRSNVDQMVLVTPESVLAPEVRAQMNADYQNVFKTLATGESLTDPGVGTFKKLESGALLYVPADINTAGSRLAYMEMGPASTFDYIASSAPLIAAKWKSQYGYTPGLWCYEDVTTGLKVTRPPAPAPYDPHISAASQLIPIYQAVYGRLPTDSELKFGVDCLTGGKWTTQSYQDWLFGDGHGQNGGQLGGGGNMFN